MGKGELPLFWVNGEQVINIYASYQTATRGCGHHALACLIKFSVPYVQHPEYGQGWKDSGAEVFSCGVPNFSKGISHLGLPLIPPGISPAGRAGRDT